MTQRAWIRKGDRTTANGVVTSGLETFTLLDQPIAFEGDSIACPACNSTGLIRCVGTRVPTTAPHGREMALEGDLCICLCNPPPRLIASQNHSSTEGHTDFAPRDDGGFFAGRHPAPTKTTPATQRFHICDEDSKAPIANRLYRLHYPGGMLEGRTDADGYTDWVSGIDGASCSIEVFGEAV